MRTRFNNRIRFSGDSHHAQGLAIATQFGQQIEIVLTRIRMAGDKHHHQRFVIYK